MLPVNSFPVDGPRRLLLNTSSLGMDTSIERLLKLDLLHRVRNGRFMGLSSFLTYHYVALLA